MAYVKGKTGSFVINGTKNLDFKVYYEETYELSSNTSIVVLKPYCIIQQTGGGVRYYLDGVISCNGTQLIEMDSYSGTHYFDGAYQTEKQVITATSKAQLVLTSNAITHNADGSKTVAIAVDFYGYSQGAVGINAFRVNGSANIVLTKIPRAATITSAPNFTDEENPTIKYSNAAGTAVDSLQACISLDGSSANIAYRDISKTGSSYTFTLTESERNVLRKATLSGSESRSIKFYVKTVIGGSTFYSNIEKTFTVVNAEPQISALVIDTNTKTTALTGDSLTTIVKGYSNAAYEISATALKGASITEYKAVSGSVTKTTSSGTFANAETASFNFTVKDNRGLTASKLLNLKLINYFKPTCNAVVTLELDTETTLRAEVKVTGTFFNGSFGYKNNSLDIYIKHSSSNEWVNLKDAFIEPTTNGNNYSLDFGISNLDYTKPFTYQVKVVDALEEIYSAEETLSYNPIFDWSAEDFNFNVPVSIQGNNLADFVIETGTEAMGTNGTWYWRKWASGRAECYGVRNYGNMAVTTAWGSIYYSEAFTQSLPSGLFVDAPEVCDISFRGSSSNWAAFIIPSVSPTKTTSTTFYVARPATGTITQARISFNVIGRWK